MAGISPRPPDDPGAFTYHACPPGWNSWQEYAAYRLDDESEVAESFPDGKSDNPVCAADVPMPWWARDDVPWLADQIESVPL